MNQSFSIGVRKNKYLIRKSSTMNNFIGIRVGQDIDWSSYWSVRYISSLSVVTTSPSTQTVTATIVGTGFDSCSFEYSTDYGVTWIVAGNAVNGIYSATGLISSTRYDWRARLFKGSHYSAYSNIDYAVTSTHANLIAGWKFNQPDYFQNAMTDFATNYMQSSSEYYNGKTYIAYQGDDDDPYITSYDHATGLWATPVKIGTNPLVNGDGHGEPIILIDSSGYIHIMYGSHIGPQKYAKSTNPEDISAWTAMTDPIDGVFPTWGATYPALFQFSDDKMYLFYRDYPDAANESWGYKTSVDGGVNWSAYTKVFDTHYHYCFFTKGIGDTIHAVAIGGGYQADRQDLYYLIFDGTNWKNISGTNKTLPIAYPEASILAYDSGVEWTPFVRTGVDASNNPYIFFTEGHTADPVGGGAGTFKYRILKYSSGWLDYDIGVNSDEWRDMAMAIDVRSSLNIDVYVVTNGATPDVVGGDIQKWSSTDGGVTWEHNRNILKGRFADPMIVRNYHDNAKLIFVEYAGNVLATRKAYVWGDAGFIKGAVSILGTTAIEIKGLYNGTLVNTPTSIDGKFGKGFSFSGASSEYIEVGDNDVFSFDVGSPDHAFSISFWIKDINTAVTQVIIAKHNVNPNVEWMIIPNAGKIQVSLLINTGAKAIVTTAPYTNAGTWDFICITYDGAGLASGIKIYNNLSSIDNVHTEDAGYTGMSNTSAVLRIAARDVSGAQYYMTGSLDEVKIWDKVLSGAEMALEMANTL